MASAALTLNGVAVERGGRLVVAGVTFDVGPGEAVILKGANGSGKTTLLRAIAGLSPLAAGSIEIRVDDRSSASDASRRAQVVHCGHADAIKAQMTVRESIAFWAALYGAPRDRIDGALREFDLTMLASARAGELSAGQRRRLGLARIVVAAKSVWLLDEPTASVDAASTERLLQLIARHRTAGGAVVIATHDRIAVDDARSFVLEAA